MFVTQAAIEKMAADDSALRDRIRVLEMQLGLFEDQQLSAAAEHTRREIAQEKAKLFEGIIPPPPSVIPEWLGMMNRIETLTAERDALRSALFGVLAALTQPATFTDDVECAREITRHALESLSTEVQP